MAAASRYMRCSGTGQYTIHNTAGRRRFNTSNRVKSPAPIRHATTNKQASQRASKTVAYDKVLRLLTERGRDRFEVFKKWQYMM